MLVLLIRYSCIVIWLWYLFLGEREPNLPVSFSSYCRILESAIGFRKDLWTFRLRPYAANSCCPTVTYVCSPSLFTYFLFSILMATEPLCSFTNFGIRFPQNSSLYFWTFSIILSIVLYISLLNSIYYSLCKLSLLPFFSKIVAYFFRKILCAKDCPWSTCFFAFMGWWP